MPSQGDILLVPIPFTDQSSTRRRPVIVISNDLYNKSSPDLIVVCMTSNLAPSPHAFTITTADLRSGTLNHSGKVRVDKVVTIAKSIIVKSFGKVNAQTLDRIRQLLQDLCSP
jgi:mRNA interferase MazF